MPDTSRPDTPQESTAGVEKQFRRLADLVGESGTALLALGAISSALGFAVVNLYLLQYTPIHGFNVVTGQYIAAAVLFFSVSLVLAWPIRWLYRLVTGQRRLAQILAVVLIVPLILAGLLDVSMGEVLESLIGPADSALTPGYLLLLFVLVVYATLLMGSLIKLQEPREGAAQSQMDRWFARFFRVYAYISLVVLVPVAIIAFFLTIYAEIPRALGGGKPSPAILILMEDEDVDALNLRMDPAEALYTAPLEILAELNDGLLIRAEDEQGAIVVMAVKHDSIRAILSVPETFLPTPAPAATATPPPALTPTP